MIKKPIWHIKTILCCKPCFPSIHFSHALEEKTERERERERKVVVVLIYMRIERKVNIKSHTEEKKEVWSVCMQYKE